MTVQVILGTKLTKKKRILKTMLARKMRVLIKMMRISVLTIRLKQRKLKIAKKKSASTLRLFTKSLL